MKGIKLYINRPMSFYEIGSLLRSLPTPRKHLFNAIVSASGLSPNSVKMMLCTTADGYMPSIKVREQLAMILGRGVNDLFPEDKRHQSSIYNLYNRLQSKKVEFNEFINQLSTVTKVTPKTVCKWLTNKRVPKHVARKEIATILDMPINHLFPQEERLM